MRVCQGQLPPHARACPTHHARHASTQHTHVVGAELSITPVRSCVTRRSCAAAACAPPVACTMSSRHSHAASAASALRPRRIERSWCRAPEVDRLVCAACVCFAARARKKQSREMPAVARRVRRTVCLSRELCVRVQCQKENRLALLCRARVAPLVAKNKQETGRGAGGARPTKRVRHTPRRRPLLRSPLCVRSRKIQRACARVCVVSEIGAERQTGALGGARTRLSHPTTCSNCTAPARPCRALFLLRRQRVLETKAATDRSPHPPAANTNRGAPSRARALSFAARAPAPHTHTQDEAPCPGGAAAAGAARARARARAGGARGGGRR